MTAYQPETPSHVLETFGLTRRFGNVLAVDDVALRVPSGCVYGFLGPNGAGKTTTIRMLLGLIRPNVGNVLLFGAPLNEQRATTLRRIGSLVETPSLYPHLTGRENLELLRRLMGGHPEAIQRALEIVRLEDAARRRVGEYSLGMRQRLGLAAALLGQPDLLILDEPTNGLDPAGIHEMRELIRSLPQKGITVFLSSHLLAEVEQIATHIGIIHEGQLIFQGTPEDLRSRYHEQLQLTTDRLDEAQLFLQSAGWQVNPRSNGSAKPHHLTIPVNGLSDVARVNTQLVQAGYPVFHLNLTQPSLEDIFLNLTQQGASL